MQRIIIRNADKAKTVALRRFLVNMTLLPLMIWLCWSWVYWLCAKTWMSDTATICLCSSSRGSGHLSAFQPVQDFLPESA